MNQNPILVRKIKHLTDARYFAAMGVDWMSITLDETPASFVLWHTLREWVEGVKLAAEIDPGDDMLLAKTIIDAVPQGIVLLTPATTEWPAEIQLFYLDGLTSPDQIPAGSAVILPYSEDQPLEFNAILKGDHSIFLEAAWTTTMIEALLRSGYTGGFCFSGGEETATGMRDYEAMDEMLGLLRE